MSEYVAKCIELKIRENIAEAVAEASVTFDSKSGTVEISGLPPGLNKDDITVSCEKAYTDLESVVDPTQLGTILAKNPKVTVTKTSGKTVEGRIINDNRDYRKGLTLVKDDGTVCMLTNEEVIDNIELKEKLKAEPLLRIAYSREKADEEQATISIQHLLSGLGFGGIVYEFNFGEEKLGLSPFVYVTNQSPFDFKDVKLTLVMPEKPTPKGDRVRTEISPLEQQLSRSEDIGFKMPQIPRSPLGRHRMFAAALRSPDMGAGGETMLCELAEIEPAETIEGTVAAVDTEGKYSLSQGENKRVRLKGVTVDNYHKANVLILNPTKYEESGIYHTTIIDAVRFTPDTDLKAGSFYSDGQQLQSPAMKKDQEYELGLRTCRNLEAQVSKEESVTTDGRQRRVVTITYNVKLINNTADEQTVEVNIPVEPIRRSGAEFNPKSQPANRSYDEKTIAGEQFYVTLIGVPSQSPRELKFELKTSSASR